MDEWIITYRGYSDADLNDEFERLKKQSENPFVAQAQGSRSFQRSTGDVRERLAAISMVRQERGSGPACGTVADFSNVQP